MSGLMPGLRLVPVNVDEDLWVQAVRVAASRGTTVSTIVAAVLQQLVDEGEAS